MSDRIERIISLIFTTRRMMHEQKALKSKNCSPLHLIALGIVQNKKPLMKELADYLGITPPSATSLVGKLAKDELVYRQVEKDDRRIVRILISKKGKKYLETHKKLMAEKMRTNLSRLSMGEQQQFEKILKKISVE
ncbi:MAG: MarR family transcriptional regulator [Candidatus Moraniibacteriota bacterium]